MSVAELLATSYAWVAGHAGSLFLAALAVPSAGTAACWLAGRTSGAALRDRIASLCVGVGLCAVGAEIVALLVAHYLLGRSLLDADTLVLLAPLACLATGIGGIRLLRPVGDLASVRASVDLAVFVLAGVAALWLLSRFRGWGFLFFGGLGDFVVIAVLAAALLRRLYRRAVGSPEPPSARPPRLGSEVAR